MKEFIIVKYADQFPPEGAYIHHSIFKSYSANRAGIDTESYASIALAKEDLAKYNEINPTVYAGIVPCLR